MNYRSFTSSTSAAAGVPDMGVPLHPVAMASKAAAAQSPDPVLVCAVVEQESVLESAGHTLRARYSLPKQQNKRLGSLCPRLLLGPDASNGAGRARGGLRSPNSYLRFATQGLGVGCKVLRKKLDAMPGDILRGLLAWNGGANPAYPAKWFAPGAAAGARH